MNIKTLYYPLVALLCGLFAATAQATAVSSSQVTLDLASFAILPDNAVTLRTPEAYASGANANATSDPGETANPQVNDGPMFGATGWVPVDAQNSATNALARGYSDTSQVVVSADAAADGTANRAASASAFVHHNIDFALAATTDMRFEIDYLISQAYSRTSATDDAVSAYSQVSLQLRRSGFRNGQYFLENLADALFPLSGGLGGGLLNGASGDIGGTLVLAFDALPASVPEQFYTIEANVYTSAVATTRDLVAVVPAPGVGLLLLTGIAAMRRHVRD